MARAIHSGYYDGHPRAGQVRRAHIIREDGPARGLTAMCGQGVWPTTNATPVVLDPMPVRPPDGLTWCPHCLGRLAERLDALWWLGEQLARRTAELDLKET
ncbi:hypothetical protein OHR68_09805 [Spirillospora sp. NBC_00431]